MKDKELKRFIKDVTLYLQVIEPRDKEQKQRERHILFQRAYRLYVKHGVESL